MWKYVSINRREENKDDGYQRVLANSRVRAVADYIKDDNIIPGSIIISVDKGKYDPKKGRLTIGAGKDVAWVIDGQHRLAGAHLASQENVDIELNVIAILGLSDQGQIEQFVTINREGKNVPTSLYLDLLKHLPKSKTPGEVAAERATDIANDLRRNRDSIFYGRIVVTTSPGKGQVSIVNFVRKLTPYVNPEKGLLNLFTLAQQIDIVDNYFNAVKSTYSEEWKKTDSIFFKTVGFGALMNVFEDIFKECTMRAKDSASVTLLMYFGLYKISILLSGRPKDLATRLKWKPPRIFKSTSRDLLKRGVAAECLLGNSSCDNVQSATQLGNHS